MLLTEDPQMQPVRTPFGVVTFLQVRYPQRFQFILVGKVQNKGEGEGGNEGQQTPLGLVFLMVG